MWMTKKESNQVQIAVPGCTTAAIFTVVCLLGVSNESERLACVVSRCT